MQGATDPYAVLGVAPTSDEAVIRAAYRALMFKYHPDVHPDVAARNRAAEINEAYNILANPERRAAHDVGQAQPHTWARPPGTPPPPPPRQPAAAKRKTKTPLRKGTLRWNWNFPLGFTLACTIAAVAGWSSANTATFKPPQTVRIELPSVRPINGNTLVPVSAEMVAEPTSLGSTASTGSQSASAVDFRVIEGAVRQLNVVMEKHGIEGARNVSEKCHDDQRAAPDWAVADRCAAFDIAAAYIDQKIAAQSNGTIKREAYFVFMGGNLVETYAGLTTTPEILSFRVDRVRDTAVAVAEQALRKQSILRDAGEKKVQTAAY